MPPRSKGIAAAPKRTKEVRQSTSAAAPPYAATTRFVVCDGCSRVITYVAFRCVESCRDVCNVCRLAIEKSPSRTIRGQNNTQSFPASDELCFMGRAPLGAEVRAAVGGTDDDEVHPEKGLKRRLSKNVRVIGGRVAPRAEARLLKRSRSESSSSAEDSTKSAKGVEPARRRSGARAIALRKESTDHAAPPKSEPRSRDANISLGGRGRKKSVKGVAPDVGDIAVSQASKRAVDEDDRPFLLSLSSIAAMQEAESQPIGVAADPVTPSAEVSSAAGQPTCLESSRRHGNKALAPAQHILATYESSPVAAFFRGVTSVMSSRDVRPELAAPPPLRCESDVEEPQTVAEGMCCQVGDGAFVGYSRRVIAAEIVPTASASDGLWISIACEDQHKAYLELWHCDVAAGGTLAAPQRMYAVALGASGVIGTSWVPASLPLPSNDTLGVCTFLRQQLVLTCQLPRRGYPAPNVLVQIAGAQQIRVDPIKTPPAALQWITSHKSIQETFLCLVFHCASVALYQPHGDAATGKLNLTLVRTVQPPTVGDLNSRSAFPFVFPSYLRAPAFACGGKLGSESGLLLAVGLRDQLVTFDVPTLQLTNLLTISNSNVSAAKDGRSAVSAVASIQGGGLALASEAALHVFSATLEHTEVASCVCSAPVSTVIELSSGRLLCGSTDGQCVEIERNRPQDASILLPRYWIRRVKGTTDNGGALPAPHLFLQTKFEAQPSKNTPAGTAVVRYAAHRLTGVPHSDNVLAFSPDGAWVLLTSHHTQSHDVVL